MKNFSRSKWIWVSVVLVALFIFLFFWSYKNRPNLIPIDNSSKNFGWKIPLNQFPETGGGKNLIAYSDIRAKNDVPEGLPVTLLIPSIGVDTLIEDALITPQGKMDVPIGSVNVAWFSLGVRPGQIGSAVIGGHFGIKNGIPFVFYNLHNVKVGDTVSIINDKNKTISFIVRSMSLFDRNADATSVFSSSDGLAHLNLVTCEGEWNVAEGGYPKRLVVFSDLEK